MKGLPSALAKKVLAASPNISRRRILVVELGELADRLGVTLAEAAQVRSAALGLSTAPSTRPGSWDRPTRSPTKKPTS